jgi:general stress protein 26
MTATAALTDEQLLAHALTVVNNCKVGLMCTAGPEGYPRGRWMSAAPQNGLRTLVTLTAQGTRKLEELAKNNRIGWTFSTDAYGDVVTLLGKATVSRDALRVQEAWDRLKEAVRTYAVGPLSDENHLQMVTIETSVDQIEVIFPALHILTPRVIKLR